MFDSIGMVNTLYATPIFEEVPVRPRVQHRSAKIVGPMFRIEVDDSLRLERGPYSTLIVYYVPRHTMWVIARRATSRDEAEAHNIPNCGH